LPSPAFGGVIAFVFGDLIIIPILNIYRKYYTRSVSLYLLAASYTTMALAGLIVSTLFAFAHLVPGHRSVGVFTTAIGWDANTYINIAFLALVIPMLVRFLRTGGIAMLKMMGGAPDDAHAHHRMISSE